jgi:phosphate-selective porin
MKNETMRRALTVLGMAALAATDGAAGEDLAARVSALEARIGELSQGSGVALEAAQLHGYGELHYNNLSGEGGASDKDEVDFHRFVLFVGYDFTPRIRFRSELEVEHSVTGGDEPGEVELEQAFLDFDVSDRHTARAGLFLVPVGLLNTTHEPARFYGVERNPVETSILPTTWWEAGAGLHGDLGAGFRYEAYLHSGLNIATGTQYAVRGGRQKVAQAQASDPAATLALSWSIPGVTLGGAVHHQTDVAQGEDPEAGGAWMGELHADVRRGPFGLRALYAEWTLDGTGPESAGADRQFGWYVEPSVRVTDQVGLFARYSEWDNRAGDDDDSSRKRQVNAGVNWWPHEQVVVKADYQWQDHEDGRNQNGINLGLGYEF